MESTAGRPRTLYPCFSMHAPLPRSSWKNNLCQRIGFTGPSDAFTEQGCMHHAMCIFLGYFNEYLKDRTRRRGPRANGAITAMSKYHAPSVIKLVLLTGAAQTVEGLRVRGPWHPCRPSTGDQGHRSVTHACRKGQL